MEESFWWVIFPYISGTILVLGSVYRFVFRRMTCYAPSTEIFEKKWLRLGSLSFHWGILFAFVGHAMGILIPKGVYDWLNITNHMYHFFAIVGGGFAGLMVSFGLIVIIIRKIKFAKVRVHTTLGDYFAVVMLMVVAGLGTYMTLIYNTTVVAYEYRTSIGPWFRSLFTLQPQHDLMLTVPLILKIHVILSFFLFASIPFTQLIHMFSFPGRYPARAPQQYRSRNGYKKS